MPAIVSPRNTSSDSSRGRGSATYPQSYVGSGFSRPLKTELMLERQDHAYCRWRRAGEHFVRPDEALEEPLHGVLLRPVSRERCPLGLDFLRRQRNTNPARCAAAQSRRRRQRRPFVLEGPGLEVHDVVQYIGRVIRHHALHIAERVREKVRGRTVIRMLIFLARVEDQGGSILADQPRELLREI